MLLLCSTLHLAIATSMSLLNVAHFRDGDEKVLVHGIDSYAIIFHALVQLLSRYCHEVSKRSFSPFTNKNNNKQTPCSIVHFMKRRNTNCSGVIQNRASTSSVSQEAIEGASMICLRCVSLSATIEFVLDRNPVIDVDITSGEAVRVKNCLPIVKGS